MAHVVYVNIVHNIGGDLLYIYIYMHEGFGRALLRRDFEKPPNKGFVACARPKRRESPWIALSGSRSNGRTGIRGLWRSYSWIAIGQRPGI